MIDLHMHSRYSDDGEFTPSELIEQCAEKGIHTVSVTDHNCVRANEEAAKAAGEKGIRYLPGIEIDCTYKDTNLHVLGYDIDYRSCDFKEIEKNIDDQSFQASLDRLAKTQTLGFGRITEKDMWELIHRNHGVAVIAHPGVNLKGKEFLLTEILTLGVDGIEAFSSYHSSAQADYYCKAAIEKHIFVTCGSDYHGKTKPSISIGQHGCPFPSPADFREPQVNALLSFPSLRHT